MTAAQVAQDKLMGLPRKGIHRGAGRHVAIPDVYLPGAPGWTAHQNELRKHPTKDEYALGFDAETVAALADPAKRDKLEAGELSDLDAKEAAADELPADWDEDQDQP